MNGSLNDATKNILQLAQVVFSHTKPKLSDPMQTLCGFLSDDWLSHPSLANHQVLMKILNACVPQLKPPFEASYISNDPHHVSLQMIQNTLSELKTDHSSTVGHYFDLACTWLNVLMAMDAAYKSTITWVDELAHAKEIAKTAQKSACFAPKVSKYPRVILHTIGRNNKKWLKRHQMSFVCGVVVNVILSARPLPNYAPYMLKPAKRKSASCFTG